MKRLYLKIYLTIVVTLLLVVLVTTLIAATLTWTTPAILPVRAGWAELVLTLLASSAVFVAVVVVMV